MLHYFLHVGPDKTGTSHLQQFLARNVEALARKGIVYPASGTTQREAAGEVLSGNGYSLFVAARAGVGVPEIVQQHSTSNSSVLVSSEALDALSVEQLQGIWRDAERAGFRPRIIYYVRAPLDRLVSAAMQWVKRSGGIWHPRELIEANLGNLKRFPAAQLRARVDELVAGFGRDSVDLRTYHPAAFRGGRIETDLLQAVGVSDCLGLVFSDHRTNPSLTEEALNLLLAVNRERSSPALAIAISDFLMQHVGAPVVLPRDLLDLAASEFADDITHLTQAYQLEHLSAYTDAIAGVPAAVSSSAYLKLCAETLVAIAEKQSAPPPDQLNS